MRRNIILVYLSIILIIIILFSYFFLYNIYGDEIRKSPPKLFADSTLQMKIEVVPVNAFGWRALYRKSNSHFFIIEGNDLIELISIDNVNGLLIIQSNGKPGKVGIKIKSQYSLLPAYIEISILTLSA
jgi:hypothetical protein